MTIAPKPTLDYFEMIEREADAERVNGLDTRRDDARDPLTPVRLCTDDYRGFDAVSQSDLKLAFNEPQLYEEINVLKTRERSGPTAAMAWGTLCEAYLRDGSAGAIIIPNEVLNAQGHRKGSAWSTFKANHPDDTLLTQNEFDSLYAGCEQARQNVMGHEPARAMLDGCLTWHTRWTWSDGDLNYKAEHDLHSDTLGLIVDVKTAAETDPKAFERSIIKFGYDIQAAHYCWPFDDYSFAWLVIKNKPPYNVEVYECSAELMNFGKDRLDARIEWFKACCDTGVWRSATHGNLTSLYPPKWAVR